MYPKRHVVPGLPVPAIGRYPIKKAIAEDWPEIKEETWYRLAIVISENEPEMFFRIHAVCNKKLERNMAIPAQYAAKYIQAPQLATAATHSQGGAASSSSSQPATPPPPQKRPPPPPPNHPPSPRYSVTMVGGVRGFEPDATMELKFGESVSFGNEKIEEC